MRKFHFLHYFESYIPP